jgi:hypothetical protein
MMGLRQFRNKLKKEGYSQNKRTSIIKTYSRLVNGEKVLNTCNVKIINEVFKNEIDNT